MASNNLTPWQTLKTELYLDSQDDHHPTPLPQLSLQPLKQTNLPKRQPLLLQISASIKDSSLSLLRYKRRSLQDDSTRQKRLSSKKIILPQIQIKYPIPKQITLEGLVPINNNNNNRLSKKRLQEIQVCEYILTSNAEDKERERMEIKRQNKPKRASSHLGIHNLRYFSSSKVQNRNQEQFYDGGERRKEYVNNDEFDLVDGIKSDKLQKSVNIRFEGKDDMREMKRVYSTKKIKHHFLDSLLERMH